MDDNGAALVDLHAQNKGYTHINNAVLYDPKIGLNEKGLALQLLSVKNNPNWEHSYNGYASMHKSTYRRMYTSFRKLERAGYVERIQERNQSTGRFGPMRYDICDQPIHEAAEPTILQADSNHRRGPKGNFIKVGESGWTNIVNNPCMDKDLSYRALAMLAILVSLPPNYKLNFETLRPLTADGAKVIRDTVHELECADYVFRCRLRQNDGTLRQAIWIVSIYRNAKEAAMQIFGDDDAPALQPALFLTSDAKTFETTKPAIEESSCQFLDVTSKIKERAEESAVPARNAPTYGRDTKFKAIFRETIMNESEQNTYSQPEFKKPATDQPNAANADNKVLSDNKILDSNKDLPSQSLTHLEQALERAVVSLHEKNPRANTTVETVIPPHPAHTSASLPRVPVRERASFDELLSIAVNKSGLTGVEGRLVEHKWNEVLNTGIHPRTVLGAYALYAEDRVKRGQRRYIRRLSKWLDLSVADGVHYWTAVYEDEVNATRNGVKRAVRKYRPGKSLTNARHVNSVTLIEDPQNYIRHAIEYSRAKAAGVPYTPSKPVTQFELLSNTSTTKTAPDSLSNPPQTLHPASALDRNAPLAHARVFAEAPTRERAGVPSFVPWATADGGVDRGTIANFLRDHAKPPVSSAAPGSTESERGIQNPDSLLIDKPPDRSRNDVPPDRSHSSCDLNGLHTSCNPSDPLTSRDLECPYASDRSSSLTTCDTTSSASFSSSSDRTFSFNPENESPAAAPTEEGGDISPTSAVVGAPQSDLNHAASNRADVAAKSSHTNRHRRAALDLVAQDLGIDAKNDPEEYAALAAEMGFELGVDKVSA